MGKPEDFDRSQECISAAISTTTRRDDLDGDVESREAILEVSVDQTTGQLVSEVLDLFVENLLRKICRRRTPEGSLGLVVRRALLCSFAQTFKTLLQVGRGSGARFSLP